MVKKLAEKKKIVQLDYTAREQGSGAIFDTTLKEAAEEAGLNADPQRFKPVTIILGQGEMHKALEEEIGKMGVGEQKKIMLAPEQAFGERKAQNIAIMPLQNFKDNKMMPFPGMVFEANGLQGKVQSVSGGRVRVDFNHPLAGKTLEYEIKLLKEITEKKEAIAALYEKFLPLGTAEDRRFELNGTELTMHLPKQLNLKDAEPLKKVLEKIIIDNVEGIKKVSFIEHKEEAKMEATGETQGKKEAVQEAKLLEKTNAKTTAKTAQKPKKKQ